MTKEIKIAAFSIAFTALIGGVGVVCSDLYNKLKYKLKKEHEAKVVAVDHLARYDSILGVYAKSNDEMKLEILELREKLTKYTSENSNLTTQADSTLGAELYNRWELDSIRQSLLNL